MRASSSPWWGKPNFNGAAPNWARRAARRYAGSSGRRTTSTGPRPIGRGESRPRKAFPTQPGDFNGAAPNWARREVAPPVVVVRTNPTSTGPRPIGRGEIADGRDGNAKQLDFNGAAPNWARRVWAAGFIRTGWTSLQRGRAQLGAERRTTRYILALVTELQRGRAQLGAESDKVDAAVAKHYGTSTGPRPIGRGESMRSRW